MKIDRKFKNRLKDFLKKKIKEEQRRKVIIETPYKLKDDEIKMLKKMFSQLEYFQIENKINEDLIGGFILRHGSSIFDASIGGKINQLVSKLL